jgi:hypothetical protein
MACMILSRPFMQQRDYEWSGLPDVRRNWLFVSDKLAARRCQIGNREIRALRYQAGSASGFSEGDNSGSGAGSGVSTAAASAIGGWFCSIGSRRGRHTCRWIVPVIVQHMRDPPRSSQPKVWMTKF